MSETLDGYLTKLASAEPVPGGGSAAMVVGAAGCALVAMTARICLRSPKYAACAPEAARLARGADELQEHMLRVRIEDEAAFERVVAARGNREAMQDALLDAAGAPLRGAQASVEALRLAHRALELRNPHLTSDLGCAAEFAFAALAACAYNVRINHRFMHDAANVAAQAAQLERVEREGQALLAAVRAQAR